MLGILQLVECAIPALVEIYSPVERTLTKESYKQMWILHAWNREVHRAMWTHDSLTGPEKRPGKEEEKNHWGGQCIAGEEQNVLGTRSMVTLVLADTWPWSFV